jgi:hypothetical protein
VNGVIGHLNSGTTRPASQIYNYTGIPQIAPSATNPKYTRQGYAGAFRRSELSALDMSDLKWTPEGVTITVRRSKTDQRGKVHHDIVKIAAAF